MQRLTLSSGPGMKIPMRTVFALHKEITPRTSGKTFALFQAYVVDSNGHYTAVQRRVFGNDQQRQKILKDMQAFFAPGKVFVLSKVTGVERNNPQYACVSVPHIINYDRIGRPDVTAHFTPQLESCPLAAKVPKTIEPQESLADLLRIPEKRMVNFMALVVSAETPAGMQQEMVKVTLADFTGRIQVRFWGSQWRNAFAEKEGQLVCGFNFWASLGDGSDDKGATPALRLSSVDMSHLLWPLERDLLPDGKGRKLLAEKERVLETIMECLTDDGNPFDADNANYETAEATATVAALMELANKYFQPLPDSLFQLQGAFISLSARGAENMLTKAARDLCQQFLRSQNGLVPVVETLLRACPQH